MLVLITSFASYCLVFGPQPVPANLILLIVTLVAIYTAHAACSGAI